MGDLAAAPEASLTLAMLDLIPASAASRTLRVLCIGAHCDDIEIGCGGTLLALQRAGTPVQIHSAVLSGTAERRREALVARNAFVRPSNRGALHFGDFQDGQLPGHYAEVKDFVEALKARTLPDVVLCHERADRHQDHRLVNEMVWSTFRNHVVLEYEIPKWDGGLGDPNVYVPLTAAQANRKADAIVRAYRSQADRDWFTPDTFLALMRLRGIECRAPQGYAEAFHGRKLLFRTP